MDGFEFSLCHRCKSMRIIENMLYFENIDVYICDRCIINEIKKDKKLMLDLSKNIL